MNPSSTTITNATNGAIITVTRLPATHSHYGLVITGFIGLACIVSGLWLMFRKPLPK